VFRPYKVELLEADGNTYTRTRTITIVPQLDEVDTLGVLAHEVFHGSCPELVEEAALRFEHNWLAVFRPLFEQMEVF